MTKALLIAVRTTAVTLIVTGIIYPYVVTGLAQLLFPYRANGSLVTDEHGQAVGSELIGQNFTHPAYFQPRPSAAGDRGYDAAASSGSNLGPTSKKLQERVVQDLERLKKRIRTPRVARTRGVAPERVRAVVEAYSEGRDLGILGEPRLNVLLLNLALDRQFGRPAAIARQEG